MIEEFARRLAQLQAAKQAGQHEQAAQELDADLQQLVGSDLGAIAGLSEAELMALLIKDGPTHLFRDKALMVATLLKEGGDLAEAKGQCEQSRECYLKSMHLLLSVTALGEAGEFPDFVPQIEMLRSALSPRPLPLETTALLMQHYERAGEFAKAENALFTMVESAGDADILGFASAFYRRLGSHSEAALAAGNFSREEVEQGRKEIEQLRQG